MMMMRGNKTYGLDLYNEKKVSKESAKSQNLALSSVSSVSTLLAHVQRDPCVYMPRLIIMRMRLSVASRERADAPSIAISHISNFQLQLSTFTPY